MAARTLGLVDQQTLGLVKSVAQPVFKWLPDTVIADEVENRISQFAHQAPIQIRDTAFGLLLGAVGNSDITGAVHGGVVYLFRDQLTARAGVQRTLFLCQ